MSVRFAINGFGRIGRLALRCALDDPSFECVHVNDPNLDIDTAAHLLVFDSVHGRLHREVTVDRNSLIVSDARIGYSRNEALTDTSWSDLGVQLVIDCTGVHTTRAELEMYRLSGVDSVIVSTPVREDVPNVVFGVNEADFDPETQPISSASSCTTNCIGPVTRLIHENWGVRHAQFTTIHGRTNTQRVVDGAHTDLRRARAANESLIPTSTGSATALTKIFPELEGRLDSTAVRVPTANASLADCVYELENEVTAEEVNQVLRNAAAGELTGILGYEVRPLVSVDYRHDSRSVVVDGPSTRVIDRTSLKLMLWYDNEWGYANRVMDLARLVTDARL